MQAQREVRRACRAGVTPPLRITNVRHTHPPSEEDIRWALQVLRRIRTLDRPPVTPREPEKNSCLRHPCIYFLCIYSLFYVVCMGLYYGPKELVADPVLCILFVSSAVLFVASVLLIGASVAAEVNDVHALVSCEDTMAEAMRIMELEMGLAAERDDAAQVAQAAQEQNVLDPQRIVPPAQRAVEGVRFDGVVPADLQPDPGVPIRDYAQTQHDDDESEDSVYTPGEVAPAA